MAASQEFSEEQLNYYRICYVTTDILTEGLRSLFKQEWDDRYKTTLGEWKDDAKSGMDFYNGESARNQRRHAHLLQTIQKGNRAEWDCTLLFYAILYSDCIGSGLSPTIKTNVDDLRKFRNEEFAHMPRGSLPDKDFQNAISTVHGTFRSLGLSTSKIDDVKKQTYFPTKKLTLVLKEVDDLRKHLQREKLQRKVLEDQLEKEISPFCILPPKPSHHVTAGNREVAKITKVLKELKEANKNELSYLYISGNSGSGKSQLAGLVAKRFFDDTSQTASSTPCVMTLNAASPDSLLESYTLMARQVKCPEYAVTSALNPTNAKTEERISNLKTLIATRIELYTSWLLIVDNVYSMSWVHDHLPERGNEQWSTGQILITTQDVSSIPSMSSFVNHVSISRGMEADDSCSLLAMLSGISDYEIEKEVSMKLDYQPLALASAATYLKQVRQNKTTSNFTWVDYLEKIEKGQKSTTEEFLAQNNPCYPKSMTAATTLAVENAIMSDEIIGHTFALLSLCSAEPLTLDIVISYISNVDKATDKDYICLNLKRCSLVLFEEDESGAFIRVHQVVHDAIKTVMKDHQGPRQSSQIINAAAASFSQFITDIPEDNKTYSDTVHLVPHLKALIMVFEPLFHEEIPTHDKYETERQEDIYSRYCIQFGEICAEHCEFHVAKKYHEYALTTKLQIRGSDHPEVAHSYLYLGYIHQKLSDLRCAKAYDDCALEIYLKKHGPDHLDTAKVYGLLGSIHKDLGDLERAKEYQERSLAITVVKLGPDHADVATGYHKLGRIYHDLGDLERAKEYHERGLNIYRERLGPDHTDVATGYHNLGRIYHDLHDLERAKEYHKRALAINLNGLVPCHTYVAASYHYLGRIHCDLGDLTRAKEYHELALVTDQKTLGPYHTEVAKSYRHLGRIHRDLGDLERAKECHERCLAIYFKRLGPEHTKVADSYHHLGRIHRALGDLKRAMEYQECSLAITLETHGPDHTKVVARYRSLSNIYRDLGDPELAKKYHERAISIKKKNPGDKRNSNLEDPDLATEHQEPLKVTTTNGHSGHVHNEQGEDLEKSIEHQERSEAVHFQNQGQHSDVTTTDCGELCKMCTIL